MAVHQCREEEILVVGLQGLIVCGECGRNFTWIGKLNKPSNVNLQLHNIEILELTHNYCEFCELLILVKNSNVGGQLYNSLQIVYA